ncbi:MAG: hypothetical protein RL061_274, partial [Pseudomonadota bacterium]
AELIQQRHKETWPSGRRHSPAKGASGQNLDRKFESSRLRQKTNPELLLGVFYY